MIKEIKMYTVICDGCGKDGGKDSALCWGSPEAARKAALENGDWLHERGEDYCSDCYCYDSEDVLIVRKSMKK